MKINVSILEAQPFLRGMDTGKLELLAENAVLAEFNANERILYEGGAANRFYLILEGQVRLESPMPGGEAVSLQTLGRGDVLGWSWLFPPYRWHFDARAVAPTKAILFDGTHLRELCEENHDLGYELMKRVSEIVIRRLQVARREKVEENKNFLLPI